MAATRSRPGPKPLPADFRLIMSTPLRLRPAEWEDVERVAEADERSKAEWLRVVVRRALKREVKKLDRKGTKR